MRHGCERARFVGMRAATESSESSCANGCTCTVRKLAMSLVPTEMTAPDRDAVGVHVGVLAVDACRA